MTTWAEAKHFFSQIGSRTSDEEKPGGFIRHGVSGTEFAERGIHNRTYYIEQQGVIKWIEIDADGRSNPAEFQAVWSTYAPESVIAQYGQPSRVWVQTFAEASEGTPTTMPYDLWLFYDELGFLIRYGGSVEYKPVYRICPTVEDGNIGPDIEIYLQSPESQTTLEELVGEKTGLKESILPIDQATELNIEEFYALYSQTGQPKCFETPREIWP